jgi:RNA polymerase sigma-70 factor (ECF subfamily)
MRAQDEAAIVACIPSLRRYARGLLGGADHADDLVQDTLERAWTRFSFWQQRSDIRAWMFGIMHNRFVDVLRARRSRPEEIAHDGAHEPAERPRQTDALELRDLDRLLQRLPVEQREVLLLIAVEDLSYRQVAASLAIPIGTVMSRLSRARERLRQDLREPDASAIGDARLQRVK